MSAATLRERVARMCDDMAAQGDVEGLRRLSDRWARRNAAPSGVVYVGPLLSVHMAFKCRWNAVRSRLDGKIDHALTMESMSDMNISMIR